MRQSHSSDAFRTARKLVEIMFFETFTFLVYFSFLILSSVQAYSYGPPCSTQIPNHLIPGEKEIVRGKPSDVSPYSLRISSFAGCYTASTRIPGTLSTVLVFKGGM